MDHRVARVLFGLLVVLGVLATCQPARADTGWARLKRGSETYVKWWTRCDIGEDPRPEFLQFCLDRRQYAIEWAREAHVKWAAEVAARRAAHRAGQGSSGSFPDYPRYDGSHLALWLCIHSREGSWTDPNPPYFGGLQMGYGFMEAYGGHLYREKGTADHWTPNEQIGVAENAWKINDYSIGWLFSQWPATAPPCV